MIESYVPLGILYGKSSARPHTSPHSHPRRLKLKLLLKRCYLKRPDQILLAQIIQHWPIKFKIKHRTLSPCGYRCKYYRKLTHMNDVCDRIHEVSIQTHNVLALKSNNVSDHWSSRINKTLKRNIYPLRALC